MVLPINVMACDKMLVLCGKTYPTRLWCVWELFTLLAFTSRDQAARKIEFIPMVSNNGSVEDVMRPLRQFKLSDAACFDPNEENRLRSIIHARGDRHFEESICELAEVCEENLRERKFARSNSLMSMAFTRRRTSSTASEEFLDVELGPSSKGRERTSSVVSQTTDV